MTIKKIILRLAKLKAGMEALEKKTAKQESDRAAEVASAIESAETEDEKEAAAIFASKVEAIRVTVEGACVKAATAISVAIDATAKAAATKVSDDEAVDAYLKVYRDVEEEVRNNAT